MTPTDHTRQPVEEERPVDTGEAPDEQVNRTDQPDFSEAERQQYDDPPVEQPIQDPDEPDGSRS